MIISVAKVRHVNKDPVGLFRRPLTAVDGAGLPLGAVPAAREQPVVCFITATATTLLRDYTLFQGLGRWLLTPHTPSIAFRHLPLNSARTGYPTEGALFISAQLSTALGQRSPKGLGKDCGSSLAPKYPRKHEAHLPWVPKTVPPRSKVSKHGA